MQLSHGKWKLTERHGYQTHDPFERHWWLMIVVFSVSVGPQAVLLIVICVAWHSLIGVDLLDMICHGLRRRRMVRMLCTFF